MNYTINMMDSIVHNINERIRRILAGIENEDKCGIHMSSFNGKKDCYKKMLIMRL